MLADDNQVFDINEKSVENTFKILSLNEKASGFRIKYDKTNGLLLGASKRKRFKIDKIKLITGNAKTLGVCHGYEIYDDDIPVYG